MAAYLLLMTAACWHALGIGTQGHRGRIVHTLTGIGMAWGLFTGPPGLIGIGGAVATVTGVRWLMTPEGRLFAAGAGRAVWAGGDVVLCTLGRTLRWVLSPHTHEALPIELSAPVSTPRNTLGSRMATTPPAHLFEMEPWKRGTAHDTSPTPGLTPVETYADLIGSVVAGTLGFNEGARRAAAAFTVSRSKFAVDVRKIREEAA